MLYILSITVWRSLIVTLILSGLRTPRLTKWWTRDLILHNCCGKFLVSAKTVSRGMVLYCHWGSPAGRKKMIFFEFVQQNTREWGGATQIYHLAGEFYITTLVMSRPGVTRVRGLLPGEERNEISAVSGDKNGIAMFRLFISPAGVSSQVMSAKIFLATLPNHVKTFFTFFQLGLPTHNPRVKVTYIFPVLVKPCWIVNFFIYIELYIDLASTWPGVLEFDFNSPDLTQTFWETFHQQPGEILEMAGQLLRAWDR